MITSLSTTQANNNVPVAESWKLAISAMLARPTDMTLHRHNNSNKQHAGVVFDRGVLPGLGAQPGCPWWQQLESHTHMQYSTSLNWST